MPRLLMALAMAGAPLVVACSSVGGSAIRTGPLQLPAHLGAVALYSAGEYVQGTDVGLVEVHAAQGEGTIETLVPLFVQKVAQIGGNAAIIDNVSAQFQIITVPRVETYTYACGRSAVCSGQRMYPANEEVMVVSIRGRAMLVGQPGAVAE